MKPLVMTAYGMSTALGLNAAASCAAMMAGISGAARGELWDAESGTTLNVCRAPLRQWWHGIGKLGALAAAAVQDCASMAGITDLSAVPILLGCAEPTRPCPLAPLDSALLTAMYTELNAAPHPQSRLMPFGQVSGVAAFDIARDLLAKGLAQHCIVAGVDSYLHQQVMDAYLRDRRVLCESNSNGFIPGEAAGAVLLSLDMPQQPHLQILGWGGGRETGTINEDRPMTGRGMVTAMEAAFDRSRSDIYATHYTLNDLNGEHYKFKEATLAVSRLMRRQHEAPLFDTWHPSEWIGEVGAAIVPCCLGYQLYTSVRGAVPGPQALGHFGADGGERAAYVARFVGDP
ncbi:beta-ketoacyl synthase N-terminal-like domain-containing protein [Roseateles depolymerans]|uniref:Beta-ketoacyl synthase-like N-terminal domain-containing protein n=1 Tax=Roseateles depolymerans TaxID=76731 RepID=A0A0U3MEI3_9BURK|nr:beta-ketoacyl synthase N-terminal-like domain-containing protein [Roseateles depolymerans]ALV07117.1 hypothetical protein RD2015_2652 [Roseateles depolymerans]REG20100.1 3-oxoacyl-[acyl-carrier-protein] synthase-1 [Roseateles depolymerans]